MVLSMDRFVGKVAIVTGASAGIGAAIAKELVKSGVIVAGLARSTDRLEKEAARLSGEKGKLYAFKCDITQEEDIVSTFQSIIKHLGNISILVNNAGVLQLTDLINGETEKWKTTIDTNILGLCIATREAIQNMKASKTKGHIIHMNSTLGHIVMDLPGINVYGATKYAITSLAETLRFDINREKLPIKITSVSPGYVKTEGQALTGTTGEMPFLPLHPPDIADAVIYALSTPPHVNVSEVSVQAVGS